MSFAKNSFLQRRQARKENTIEKIIFSQRRKAAKENYLIIKNYYLH